MQKSYTNTQTNMGGGYVPGVIGKKYRGVKVVRIYTTLHCGKCFTLSNFSLITTLECKLQKLIKSTPEYKCWLNTARLKRTANLSILQLFSTSYILLNGSSKFIIQ
jgi:hypothetical protein